MRGSTVRGLACLAQVASEFGAVRVVAPDVERSSTGHAITSSRPLSYRPTSVQQFEAYRVNGTPADCVALGAHLPGLRGIALGAPAGVEPDYRTYATWIRRTLEVLLPARDLTLVNVNFPRAPRSRSTTDASRRLVTSWGVRSTGSP